MAYNARMLTVLIASPRDMRTQRTVASNATMDWNRSPQVKRLGVRLEPILWEFDSVPELGTGDGQEVINRQLLDPAEIVIGMFHARLGQPTPRAVSGTAEEILGGVERGAFVHVLVNHSDLPRSHDREQFADLEAFLETLKPVGLIGEFRSDDDLARVIRHILDADVDKYLQQHPIAPAPKPPVDVGPAATGAESRAPGTSPPDTSGPDTTAPDMRAAAGAPLTPSTSHEAGSVGAPPSRTAWQDRLNKAADDLLATDALTPSPQVDGTSDWIEQTLADRGQVILEAARPLLRAVHEAVREHDATLDDLWLDLIPQLAPFPVRSGSTELIEMLSLPGMLLFHSGGIAAVGARHEQLAGRLLAQAVEVRDPDKGPTPAVVNLVARLLGRSPWPSKTLHDYLVPLLAGHLGDRAAEQAWERWMYLVSVSRTYLGTVVPGVYADHPYLRVADQDPSGPHVVVGPPLRKAIADQGDRHPLLMSGLCGGSAELFEETALTFESNFLAWADQKDWQQLPYPGGTLPTGPHYPGERQS